jgi:hypothetical protein
MFNGMQYHSLQKRRTEQMNYFRTPFRSLLVLSLLTLSSAAIYAQQVEPSYDMTLQLVVGSNETGGGSDIPSDLSAVTRELKAHFAFTNYRISGTLIGRIANGGTFQYKSFANAFGREQAPGSQTFMDWSVAGFRNMPTASGKQGFQAQAFRFGARVPVIIGGQKDETGKIVPSFNYEPIGLTLDKVGLSENVPTLIGTLSLPGTSGTIFLIMTVRSAD